MVAAVRVSVTGDVKAMQADLTRVERKLVPLAARMALNKAARNVRTASRREIATTKKITPQKIVGDRLVIQKATKRFLAAIVRIGLYPIPVSKLGVPRETSTGARVKSHNYPGAFIARMPIRKKGQRAGHVGVFKRKPELVRHSRGRSQSTTPNLPIKEMTISLEPEATKIVEKHTRTTGAKSFKAEFERQMTWRLARARARAA